MTTTYHTSKNRLLRIWCLLFGHDWRPISGPEFCVQCGKKRGHSYDCAIMGPNCHDNPIDARCTCGYGEQRLQKGDSSQMLYSSSFLPPP